MLNCIGIKKTHQTGFRGIKLDQMRDNTFYLYSEHGLEEFYDKKPTKQEIQFFVNDCIDNAINLLEAFLNCP